MPSNEYSFRTHWRVEAPREDVFRLIENTPGYVRWWPAVWLKVELIQPGDADGVGKSYRLTTKGWLPYIIHWTSTTTEKRFPERLAIGASGDFVGTGVWTFTQNGPIADIVYDWNLRADKPLLRKLSFLLKPLFAFNHNWAMNKGLESLKLELARQVAPHGIPPPQPVFWFGKPRELR